MLFVVIAQDKDGAEPVRAANRPAHFEYVKKMGMVRLGGPFLAPDGETMTGSLIVLEAPDLDAAQACMNDDPYVKAGLFQSMEIRPWKQTFGGMKEV